MTEDEAQYFIASALEGEIAKLVVGGLKYDEAGIKKIAGAIAPLIEFAPKITGSRVDPETGTLTLEIQIPGALVRASVRHD